jgi:hypothetical protein
MGCGVTATTETRSVSPGGNYAATLKVSDCGAVCSPSATVTLHDLHDRLGKGDIKVFDGVGGWPVEVHWIGPRTMVVRFCGGTRFKVRSGFLEGEMSDDGEAYPRFTVIVANDGVMKVGGKVYCTRRAS